MKITVAVCTYNRFDWMEKCLGALEKQTLPREEYKVLVIDNSMNYEDSVAFRDSLKSMPNMDYIITDRSGLSYARNVALEKCKTPYIAFIDDDAIATPDWAEEILTAFKCHPGAGVVGGKVKPIWEVDRPPWLIGNLLHPMAVVDWGDEAFSIDTFGDKWLVGANTAYSISALRTVGGFSTSLGRMGSLLLCHEELAVNQAIQQLGYDVIYSPSIQVDHLIQAKRLTKSWQCQNAYWEGASRVLLERKQIEIDPKALSERLEKRLPDIIKGITETENPEAILQEADVFRNEGRSQCIEFLGIDNEETPLPVSVDWPVIYAVTPSFNAAETIDRTILSVITQSGDFSIRYHVQDGGSTDGTLEKLEKWKMTISDSNSIVQCKNVVFSYASTSDEGMYDAICRGFASMYIPHNAFMTWINADDILMQHAFATVMRASGQLPDVHWLGGTVTAFYEVDSFMTHYPVGFPREVIRMGLCDQTHWQTLQQEGTFWRKWIWDKVGGLNDRLKYAGDWDLWRRFAEQVDFVHVPWTLGVFHAREGQLATTDDGKAYQNEIDSVLPLTERQGVLEELVAKGQNGLVITELTGDFSSKRYSISQLPLGGRMPDQAKGFFRDQTTLHESDKSESSIDKGVSPSVPERPLPENDSQGNMLLALTRSLQARLRQAKHRILHPLINFLRKWHAYVVILRSGLFYYTYYLNQDPDVEKSGLNPIFHYLMFGAQKGYLPNPLFDSQWYLETYPNVAKQGINPLYHYIRYGGKQGLDPGPMFSTNAYLANNADVRESGINALLHYLKYGVLEGRRIP